MRALHNGGHYYDLHKFLNLKKICRSNSLKNIIVAAFSIGAEARGGYLYKSGQNPMSKSAEMHASAVKTWEKIIRGHCHCQLGRAHCQLGRAIFPSKRALL